MANKYPYPKPVSRANSYNSVQGGESDEDEDSDGAKGGRSFNLSYKDRRREAHTQAEQKRRDAIKKGYDYLQDLVPACGSSAANISPDESHASSGAKISKALVLQKTIEYIQNVQQQKQKQEKELILLRKEATALEIMRKNYEQLVKSHIMRNNAAASGFFSVSGNDSDFVPAEVKFQVFQLLMDSMFKSFNEKVPMNNFSELSGCIFNWLEECCKPQLLQELMVNVLHQVKSDYLKEQQEGDQQMNTFHPPIGNSQF